MSDVLIGIDLGTTNTVVATEERVLPLKVDGNVLRALPSVVAWLPDGRRVAGPNALRRRSIDPENTLFSTKRLIGRDVSAVAVDEFRRRYPMKLTANERGEAAFTTRVGTISPVDVAAAVIEAALQAAALSPKSCRAVITVPAAFGEGQRKATLEAGRKAGLAAVALLEEPIATAIAHGSSSRGHTAVYDIGGGTFDFAILDCKHWPYRILGHGGDLFLGGDDLDAALAEVVAHELLRLANWDVRNDVLVYDRLLVECERAKVRLSEVLHTDLELGQVDPDAPVQDARVTLDRAVLARCFLDPVRRTFVACDEVLHQVGIAARGIDGILLAGGSTLSPSVKGAVTAYFGRAPEQLVSPLDSIAIGASKHAQRVFDR